MNCNCERNLVACICLMSEKEKSDETAVETVDVVEEGVDTVINDFSGWLENLEEGEQPTCNIDNPEDCENCGS